MENGDKNRAKHEEKSPTAKREEAVLEFWQKEKIFEKSLEQTKDGEPFVFYDGPPFATGLPHYGHILPGTIKDAIPRYYTMNGRFVRRQWGWDCHGLPIENLIEKELNLLHKKDIEEYGIANFNKEARKSVFRYDDEWKKVVPRMGRFVDMDASYKTMDASYSESIWWAFKELYKKSLIYEGYKSMHICPRCETTLANSEVALGYKDITDISVTVKFELVDEPGTFLLAWTTTPWTLPGNVALAVGEDIEYAYVKNVENGEIYIVAEERMGDVVDEKNYIFAKKTIKGKELVGKCYRPAFDYYARDTSLENHKNGWKVYSADFVTTGEGTGIVHIAPAFGQDDMNLGKEHALPFIQHVNMDGTFKKEVIDFAGMPVKPKDDHQRIDVEILKYLARNNLLFAKKKIEHSYPHCWRCDTPLLNYAAGSWFVKASDLAETMVEENKKIHWVPENVGAYRFGNWLADTRDWAISRTRFWGAPIPVWRSADHGEMLIIGSFEELREHTRTSGNTYYVMRHGAARSNVEGFISNDKDNDDHLTVAGREQVKNAAKELKRKKIDIVYASQFIRTKETAEIISEALGLPVGAIVYDERIQEVNTGKRLNLRPIEEYRAQFSTMNEKFERAPEGGETLSDMKKRVGAYLYDTEEKYTGKNILIITHEYVAWLLESVARGLSSVETVRVKEASDDDFYKNAEWREVLFVPLPHNDEYEFDIHRPYIDAVPIVSKKGTSMEHIPEVFDCWFESGSMPYAQFHYPFENKKEFDKNFPADFIAEGQDQTRGWFYNLLVLSTGIFGVSAYKNVIVNGVVLAEDGQKMSKRLKNYPDPIGIVNRYGADALRLYLLSSPAMHAEDLAFSEKGVDEIHKKVILRMDNVLSLYKLYEESDVAPDDSGTHVLDRWIIARLRVLTRDVSEGFDRYELDNASRPIVSFVDDLSTWYARRSRNRFKSDDKHDKQSALATTKFVLLEFSKIIAPCMPFFADILYREVGGEKESVHLEVWPKKKNIDTDVISVMKNARTVVSLALELRAREGVGVRQPLRVLSVANDMIKNMDDRFVELIKEEVNVKEVVSDESILDAVKLDMNITPLLKKEGYYRELVRHIQSLRKKEGLQPRDKMVLSLGTNEVGRDIVELFREDIMRVASLKGIVFQSAVGAERVMIDDIPFTIELFS